MYKTLAAHPRDFWLHDLFAKKNEEVVLLKIEIKVIEPPSEWLNILSELIVNLWGIRFENYLKRHVGATCIGDFCMIWTTDRSVDEELVVYEGSWIGVRFKDKILPSINLAEKVFKEHGIRAAVVVSSKSVELFLYGRDILESSVLERHAPCNGLVAVLDASDHQVIGFAEYDPDCKCYRHVYDLSIFLRVLG
ncbi:MAG: hypothetical protein QXI47_03455 [Thermosphaera sp.]